MRVFFAKSTLIQLYFLREELGKKYTSLSNEQYLVLGMAMGILHGPERKNGSSLYLSANTSNTISYSPGYGER
jgi:hypothetical protein